jgi:membrane fusion protein, multidrug efflux system
MRRISLVAIAATFVGLLAVGLAYQTATWPFATAAPTTGQSAGGGARPPTPVEIAPANAQTLRDSIAAVGSLAAAESTQIAADSSGRIIDVRAVNGAAVREGDELFRLDGALLQAEFNDAAARLTLAQTQFRRTQTLARSQTAAQAQVDQSRAELDQAQSALDLVRERQNRLIVRAPFDGMLGFRLVSEGAYVTAGTPLVALDQITVLKVNLSVPERFFTALSIGQPVSLTADAVSGRTFEAKITAINPVIDASGRALQIEAQFDNTSLALRPGMLVRAEVLGPERQAVTVAESAVVPQGQDLVVFEVQAEKAVRRKVTTGERRDGWVEILSGIEAGANVVTAGLARLSDGAAVKVNEQPVSQ